MAIALEVCVDDAAGLAAALTGGADRIELCSALSLGGLTPPPGLMALAGRAKKPVYAMIRHRAGSFVFGDAETDTMLRDIDVVRAAGLAGVVLGAGLEDGRLDERRLRRLVAGSQGLGLTLHRVFDLVPEPVEALEMAIDLGFERILTSGGARSVPLGLEQLAELSEQARGRIGIMPGSGITPANVAQIVARLNPQEVHASCSRAMDVTQPRLVELGFAPAEMRVTDADTVRAMRAALRGL